MKLKANIKKPGLKVNSSIFEAFNRITSDNEKLRIQGAAGLIRILEDADDESVS